MAQRPYARLVQEVANHFRVMEIMDANEDVSFQYELTHGDDGWVLELSAVGPYAVFSRYEEQGCRKDGDVWRWNLDLKVSPSRMRP